jgi:CheY-like chemotaxis protein
MIPGDRILVVDDSEAIRQILADALEQQGYQVQTAADGHQAWELLRQNRFCYDLVITDVTMPAMDGLELLARIMADWPWIKVVLITGCADTDLKLQAQMLGAVAVLSKPCSLEQIQRTLRLALTK